MKKFLFIVQIVALLAAGCNSSSTAQSTTDQTQPTQQTQITQTQQQEAAQTPIPTSVQAGTKASTSASITTSLAPASDGIANPYKISANFQSIPGTGNISGNIGEFRVVVSATEKVTLTSITLQANQSVESNLPLTNLKIYAFRDGPANDGLSDQTFGKTVAGPIVAGQTYTFTDSMSVPANGLIDLFIQAYVSGATPGNYNAPFILTNITGAGVTGISQAFFSGNLKSQDLTVIDQSASIPVAQRDAQRVSDIGFMQSELELYFSDNNQYPNTLNDLLSDKAIALLSGSSSSKIRVAPEPADGSCTEQQNSYQYTRTSSTTFALTFCLGTANSWNSLSAGFHTATENRGVK